MLGPVTASRWAQGIPQGMRMALVNWSGLRFKAENEGSCCGEGVTRHRPGSWRGEGGGLSAMPMLGAEGLVCIEDSCCSRASAPASVWLCSRSWSQPPTPTGGYPGCCGHVAPHTAIQEQPEIRPLAPSPSVLPLTCPSVRVSIRETEIITRPTTQEVLKGMHSAENSQRGSVTVGGPSLPRPSTSSTTLEGLGRPGPSLSLTLAL